ncbi:small ribosomal subunit protein bS21c [Typha latifolia]|uniref:small ribosomal subunit protein bS21c n=1 Tax=Typha latifolia TaxID=4733 RepID=UPI003C30887D
MAVSCTLLQLPVLKTPHFPTVRHSFLPHLTLSSSRPFSLSSSFSDAAAAAVEPAVRHANVLFFRSGYNVQIVVDEDEPEEVLLRRFRREVSKAGVIQECKRRRFFENKQEEKKRKAREASRRNRRRRFVSGPRFTSSAPEGEAASKKASDDLDDNWDMPEGDLPY